MKYFAKWLRKEGGWSRIIKSEEGIPYDYEYETTCYLCTTDIPHFGKYFLGKDTFHEYTRIIDKGWQQPLNAFRIIGEILNSEGVEEGQEFTEHDIKYTLAIKS